MYSYINIFERTNVGIKLTLVTETHTVSIDKGNTNKMPVLDQRFKEVNSTKKIARIHMNVIVMKDMKVRVLSPFHRTTSMLVTSDGDNNVVSYSE